jgi:hypothetical protein
VAIDTDLGVGLKIMGGVKCDRCLKLHAVITSVFASSKDHLHDDITEGKDMEWLHAFGRNSNHDHCMMVQILAGCKLMVWQEEPSA